MKNNILSFVLLTLSLFNVGLLKAQENTEPTIQISLLTASPGDQIYEVFGHTAIRVYQPESKKDWVFNYGLFDFSSPNFLYRFVKGETDYMLGVTDFRSFVVNYAMRGSELREQVLNISNEEARDILNALLVNYEPQNRVYRYNFFFDNCATRPRDIIQDNIEGGIEYVSLPDSLTFREWVYKMTKGHKWLTFGIDLALGAKTDRLATGYEAMFLPSVLYDAFETAEIAPGNRALVAKSEVIVEADPEMVESSDSIFDFLTPMRASLLALIITVIISSIDIKRGRPNRVLDTLVFALAGISGCILFYLNFVSVHPMVDMNYNCFWLQPLHLFALIGVWVKTQKNSFIYYHFANFAIITTLMLFQGLLPQVFNPAFTPLMGILICRSGLRMYLKNK